MVCVLQGQVTQSLVGPTLVAWITSLEEAVSSLKQLHEEELGPPTLGGTALGGNGSSSPSQTFR